MIASAFCYLGRLVLILSALVLVNCLWVAVVHAQNPSNFEMVQEDVLQSINLDFKALVKIKLRFSSLLASNEALKEERWHLLRFEHQLQLCIFWKMLAGYFAKAQQEGILELMLFVVHQGSFQASCFQEVLLIFLAPSRYYLLKKAQHWMMLVENLAKVDPPLRKLFQAVMSSQNPTQAALCELEQLQPERLFLEAIEFEATLRNRYPHLFLNQEGHLDLLGGLPSRRGLWQIAQRTQFPAFALSRL